MIFSLSSSSSLLQITNIAGPWTSQSRRALPLPATWTSTRSSSPSGRVRGQFLRRLGTSPSRTWVLNSNWYTVCITDVPGALPLIEANVLNNVSLVGAVRVQPCNNFQVAFWSLAFLGLLLSHEAAFSFDMYRS